MIFGHLLLFAISCLGIIGAVRLFHIEREFAERFGEKLQIHPIKGWVVQDNFELSDAARAYIEEKKRSVAIFNVVSGAGFFVVFIAWAIAANLAQVSRVRTL